MDDVPLCMNANSSKPCPNICGGTSASTPTFAGIVSLINDRRLNKGLPPLGLMNKRVWMVATSHPDEAFLDVTAGNTTCHCDNGFFATKGWDPMTGWGTPKWEGMLKYFASDDEFQQQ
jgi:tripeptidyl-peptidase-1